MKVDIHAHFIHPVFFDAVMSLSGVSVRTVGDGIHEVRRGNTTLLPRRDAWFDPDHCIADMDRKGIDVRVLSLTAPNVHAFSPDAQAELARAINDQAFAACRAHPSRLRALACLPLVDPLASLKELDRVSENPMCVGITMGSSIGSTPLNHSSLEPIWSRINALHLPVVEHPMHPENTDNLNEYELPIRVGFMFETTVALTRMIYAGIFERYPDFPYVVAHTGAAVLMLLERLDNGYRIFPDCRKDINQLPSVYAKRLYYDTCSYGKASLMLALDTVGADHVLFGTDYPFIDTGSEHVDALPISPSDRRKILGENAVRLFGLEKMIEAGAGR
ncbi:amidohydrolase family protein [Paraburkholderia silviterrae]|uniref:Amidohydrolase n=1 Tax=Paraburkholderia silviterrae TaxID=2528715 RepID=A0A4R5M131_9BURK|nr:amidohydrolase family protein [Paraburkholderia silviterrae]TDG18815.1 amidohydrolase [Paraburkholderia silviterrae]